MKQAPLQTSGKKGRDGARSSGRKRQKPVSRTGGASTVSPAEALQEAREQIAVLRSDLEVAERGVEQALRELESAREQCARLYDFAPNACLILDRAGFIRDANVPAATMLGVDRRKLGGTLFLRLVAEEDQRACLRHLSRCRQSRSPADIVTDLTLDCCGGQRPVQMLSTPARGTDLPRESLYHTALLDLSEIRSAEQALRESESRYRILFELNPCPMYVFDEETLAFVDVNAAALHLYGYSREAFLGMTVQDIRPPEDVPRVMAAIRAQRRVLRGQRVGDRRRGRSGSRVGGPLSVGEWRHMKRDGTVFDVAITVSSLRWAGRFVRLVLVNDITGRKQIEAALQESETSYRTLFDEAADAIVVFDPVTLALVNFNDVACRRLGYSRKEFSKLRISDFEVLETAREVRQHVRKISMDRIEVFETRHRARNGTILDVEIRAKTICLRGKTLIYGIWRDITARKEAAGELRHRLALERLMAAVSSRLVNVSMAKLDAAVNKVLADVGRLMGADRCYVFRLTADLTLADNTHEWCAPGIRAQIADLRDIPTKVFPWMLKRLGSGQPLNIRHVADIPREAAAERQLMQQGQVQSALFVPIRHGGKLTGFIGCDAVRRPHRWGDSDIRLLRIIGESLANAQTRCRAAEELRASARDWQSTFDSVADAVWVLDNEQRIQRCNKAATVLFKKRIEEMVGRHCCEIAHGTRKPIPDCPVARMRVSRHRESMELLINGRWHQVVVDPLMDPNGELRGAVHIVSDITAHKQAEAALRNMAEELERRVEERTAALKGSMAQVETLQAIVNRGPVVLFLWRVVPGEWPVEMVSDNVAAVLGYTAEDLMSGRVSWPAITCPDDVPRLEGEVSRYLAQDITEWSQEYRVTNRSGETRWMQDWNRVIKDAAGTVTHIQSLVVDATTRKHAESVLERTQRTLRVLSECGHALLRRSSEQELLNEACRIAVEVGGYRMAWIGYAEHDARKSIRPMAMVRIAKSHLVRMPLTWADTRYGRGPSGVAIRTGQPCLCGDVSRDPLLAPWRREALKRGCASILALPLSTERGCLGQLTICSGQPDAFDDPECQLLQQLANDLSFGIMALRGRVERKELERQVLDISESVQRRIGQDLHDGLGQSIIGIGYLISAVQEALADKSVPEAAELKRVSKLIWKTVQDMRDMARGLFPGELMSGRVTDALRELARHTQDLYGTACHFTGPTSIRLSDANLASQVYRIAQEAVNNAAKHSKTKAIRVGLSQERGSMVLTVRDTGVGFSAKADNAAGLGQRIMRYRADLIGAALKIESIPGQGTTVTCVLPADRAGIEEMTL